MYTRVQYTIYDLTCGNDIRWRGTVNNSLIMFHVKTRPPHTHSPSTHSRQAPTRVSGTRRSQFSVVRSTCHPGGYCNYSRCRVVKHRGRLSRQNRSLRSPLPCIGSRIPPTVKGTLPVHLCSTLFFAARTKRWRRTWKKNTMLKNQ